MNEKTVKAEYDVEYPKALARALWRERNTYLIDLLVSNNRIGEEPADKRKSEIAGRPSNVFLKIGKDVVRTPEHTRLAIRRTVLQRGAQQHMVLLASDLIFRDILETRGESSSPLEWALLSYYVCEKYGFPQFISRLPDNYFDDYSSEKNEEDLKDFFGDILPFYRIFFILFLLNDEYYEIYASLYAFLRSALDDVDSDESFDEINGFLAAFLKGRRLYCGQKEKYSQLE